MNKKLYQLMFLVITLTILFPTAAMANNNLSFGAGYLSDNNGSAIETLRLSYFDSGNKDFLPSILQLNIGDREKNDFRQEFTQFNISLLKELNFLPGNNYVGLGFNSVDHEEQTNEYLAEKKTYSFPVRLTGQTPIYKNIYLNNDLLYHPYGTYSVSTNHGLEFSGNYTGYQLESGIEYLFSNNFSIYSNYNYQKDFYGEDLTAEEPIAEHSDSYSGVIAGAKLKF